MFSQKEIKNTHTWRRKNFSKQKHCEFANNFTLGFAHKPRFLDFVSEKGTYSVLMRPGNGFDGTLTTTYSGLWQTLS